MDLMSNLNFQLNIIERALQYKMQRQTAERIAAKQQFDMQRQLQLDEEKRNNDLLDGLWKAATDDGMPKEYFEHFRMFADEYRKVLTPQQQAQLSLTVSRGLYSKEDRLRDEYTRIKGKCPEMPYGDNFKLDATTLPVYAKTAVERAEWVYGMKAYLAGGKENLPTEAAPKLVPVGVIGENEQMRNIYAYRNAATGQVQIIDTMRDIPGEMYNKAVKDGFGPNMMEKMDLVPFNGKGDIMTIGDEQFQVFTGVKLTDGSPDVVKIPLGPMKESSQQSKHNPPADAVSTMNWLESYTKGDIDSEDAKKYSGWFKLADDLKNTKISATEYETDEDTGLKLPSLSSAYGKKAIALGRKFNKSHPGWVLAPVPTTIEPAGFDFGLFDRSSVYMEDPNWVLFPAQSERPIFLNGKPNWYWYIEDLPGENKHIWYDYYGRRLSQYDGIQPGSQVTEESK